MALIQKTKWLPSSLLRERPEKAYLPRHRARTAGKLVCLAPSAWNRIWGLVLAVEGSAVPSFLGLNTITGREPTVSARVPVPCLAGPPSSATATRCAHPSV